MIRLLTIVTAAALLVSCAANRPLAETAYPQDGPDSDTQVLVRSLGTGSEERKPSAKPSTDQSGDGEGVGFTQRGSGELINTEAAAKPRRAVPSDGDITFNFEGAGIPEVVKVILGDLLQENYVIAPGVGGQVTFSTARPVNGKQAMGILEMLLSWNNATLIYQEGRYVVVPTANAVQGNLSPRVGRPSLARGYEVRAIPLEFVAPTEMEKLLQPYARQGSILSADDARAMIVVAGTRAELQNYMDTITVFDVDWLAGMSIGLFPLDVVEAEDMVTELEAVFSTEEGSPLAGLIRMQPVERLNAIMVITPNVRYLDQIEDWIKRLDRAGNDAGARLFVFDVKNVKAVDLADRLNDIFGSSGGSGGNSQSAAGSVAPGLPSAELRSSSGRSINNSNVSGGFRPQTSGSNRVGGAPRAQEGGGDAAQSSSPRASTGSEQGLLLFEAEDVRITAVEENNQLLIRATPSQYETIRGAIEKLDTVPLQVHIEAMILDVRLNDALQYGVNWFLENSIREAGIAGTTGDGDTAVPGFGASGIPAFSERTDFTDTTGDPRQFLRNPNQDRRSFGSLGGFVTSAGGGWLFDGPDVRVVVDMLSNESEVKVLSAPSLLVLNNKQASINVGEQIPINSAFVNTGVGTGGSNIVQYRDTGITLTVVPRVNPGGLVFMEVQQEDSVPGAPGADGNPPVSQKVIQTEVAVQSGQTVLLAGLIKQTDTEGRNGIPGLSRIPILGHLFGSTNKSVVRSELILLLTPTVIETPSDAAALTLEYQKRLRGIAPILREQREQERARQGAIEALEAAQQTSSSEPEQGQ